MSNLLTSTEAKQFYSAIDHNDEESLTRLLSRCATEQTITFFPKTGLARINATPLLYAVQQKKPLMVDLILRTPGTNVDAKTIHGETSLYVACRDKQPCIEIIISLLNHNADVNTATKNEITPLMMASKFGNVAVMNLLIKAGANIDALDNMGYTAVKYAIISNNSDALKVLLSCGAKLSTPTCPRYNPLLFAVNRDRDWCVDILIPYCKGQKNFGEVLKSAMLRKRLDIFQKLIMNGAKLPVKDTTKCLERVLHYNLEYNEFFFDLWSNINHEDYLNPETFARLISNIFRQRDRVSFFKSSLKMIINNTPVFHGILTGYCEYLVIPTIFASNSDPNYDWTLCKDILLDFCEYVNKLGIKLRANDLITFIEYFQYNKCQFITELLAVFFKYNPDLVTMYDVINLSGLNDLKLTSQFLYNCSDFNLIESIYEYSDLLGVSEDMLKFFLQRFTPTKSDTENIRFLKKFDNINIESLEVPSLMEIARNAMRKTLKNSKIKELNICSDFEEILYFKTIMNHI